MRDARKIHVVGFSLGTSPATRVCKEMPNRVCSLVLAAPFCTILSAGFRAVNFLVRAPLGVIKLIGFGTNDPFKTIEFAEHVTAPVLVVFSSRDEVVTTTETSRLIRKFKTSDRNKFVEVNAPSHNDVMGCRETRNEIINHIKRCRNI